jgi:hypothetical protein
MQAGNYVFEATDRFPPFQPEFAFVNHKPPASGDVKDRRGREAAYLSPLLDPVYI